MPGQKPSLKSALSAMEVSVGAMLKGAGLPCKRQDYWLQINPLEDDSEMNVSLLRELGFYKRPGLMEAASFFYKVEKLRQKIAPLAKTREDFEELVWAWFNLGIAMTDLDDVLDQDVNAVTGRKIQANYSLTLELMNRRQQLEAKERWAPWRCLYRQGVELLGMSPTKTVNEIAELMPHYGFWNPETNEPYSQRTLWKQLPRIH